jgi:hypothetical protein
MANKIVILGNGLPLGVQLHDRSTSKYVRAYVKNASNVAVSGSPFNLTSDALGHYTNYSAFIPSTDGFWVASYVVYNDSGYSVPGTDTNGSGYTTEEDYFSVDASVSSREAEIDAANRYSGIIDDIDSDEGKAI